MLNKQQGQIKKWQDDKGFGFIETDTGDSVFFHINEFKARRRPDVGEQVVFTSGQDSQGRMRAKDVQELDFYDSDGNQLITDDKKDLMTAFIYYHRH